MTESLDALLSRTVNPFTPLSVGDFTVGWVGPRHERVSSVERGKWLLAVGEKVFHVSYFGLLQPGSSFQLDIPDDFSALYRYQSDLVFHMPVGSVDFADGHIVFTERTTQNILTSFSNFSTLLKSEIQSKLNNSKAEEAAEAYAKLLASVYPYLDELSWRGKPVEELEPLLSEAVERHRLLPRNILRELGIGK